MPCIVGVITASWRIKSSLLLLGFQRAALVDVDQSPLAFRRAGDEGLPHDLGQARRAWLDGAEVDDMAMLRLLARERQAYALVPPIVVRDELRSGVLAELHRIDGLAEHFYAILQDRRFPNPLLATLLPPVLR